MTSVQTPGAPFSPQAVSSQAPANLRQLLDQNRAIGARVPLGKAIELLVPLCVEVADIHRQGYGVHVHPSNLVFNARGTLSLSTERAADPPATPADSACLPPESTPGELGSASATVYSIGAILYEMLTGLSAGRGMRRPSEVVPGLPAGCEMLMAKALVADPAHRPDDLNALAQALYGLMPQPTIPPPPTADLGHLDHVGDLEVDVSLSMMPPAAQPAPVPASAPRSAPGSAPRTANGLNLAVTQAAPSQPRGSGVTAELAQLKARLESDPTPRYVVVKDGMDHGPFNAVELLHQIGNHTFNEDDVVRHDGTGEERAIRDWEEFAPFGEHARLHRDIIEEKAAIDRGVAQESKRTKGKAFVGMLVVGLLLSGAAAWFVTQVGTRSDEVAIQTETVSNIEAEGNLNVKKGAGGGKKGGSRVVGSQGGIPVLAGGQSCESAQAAYVEEMKMTGGGQADITRGQYASIMNSGSYFSHCGVPSSVAVSICVAVQNGRAVGVTVRTTPNHGSKSCISSAVRRMSFPSHPKLDVVRVNFAAE